MTLGSIEALFQRFFRCCDGSITVEAALMLPLLTTVLVTTFAFHDLFSARNARQKATYTVADMLSRETEPLTPTYLDNAMRLYDTMSNGKAENTLRVTLVAYDADSDTYSVDWSQVRGGSDLSPVASGDFKTAHGDPPTTADEERLIVVDSFATYVPAFAVGLSEVPLTARAFLRPRFSPQLDYIGP